MISFFGTLLVGILILWGLVTRKRLAWQWGRVIGLVAGILSTIGAIASISQMVIANSGNTAHGGIEAHIPAVECAPKDLTGAGDMLAGTFLYGITHGVDPRVAAKAGNYLAMKVITQIGARLHRGTRQFWDGIMAAS